MKPATSLQTASTIVILVGTIAFYLFSKPYFWVGIPAGIAFAAVTFILLRGNKIRTVRRIFIVSISVLVWVNLLLVINYWGITDFLQWIDMHQRFYYIPGATGVGFSYIPCTRFLAEMIYGSATFGQYYAVGSTVTFPATLDSLIILMIPYVVTFLFFGKAWCGWLCYLGGTVEAFAGGKKERWSMAAFRQKLSVAGGPLTLSGLKDEVKDLKFGLLLGSLLLLTALATPVFCIVCWAAWIQYPWILLAVAAIFVTFGVILPFMTKRRWWCLICPVGALATLADYISPFQVRIDNAKCSRCYDCMPRCPTYAITPAAIESDFRPTSDCDKCGTCVEICPDEAVDIYWRGTNKSARSAFIPLTIATMGFWYSWFIVVAVQLLPTMFAHP